MVAVALCLDWIRKYSWQTTRKDKLTEEPLNEYIIES